MIKKGNRYSNNRLPEIINSKAVSKILYHQLKKDKLILISASPQYWFKLWSKKNGFDLIISTELEVKCGKLTGKILGQNCYGIEKVKRLKEIIDISQFDYIYAYGDSKGDFELLKIADEGYMKFRRVK